MTIIFLNIGVYVQESVINNDIHIHIPEHCGLLIQTLEGSLKPI